MKLPPSPSPFGAWFSMYWWWITVPATLRYRQTLLSHQLLWQSIFIKEREGKQICKMELPVTVWKLLPAPPCASGVEAVRSLTRAERGSPETCSNCSQDAFSGCTHPGSYTAHHAILEIPNENLKCCIVIDDWNRRSSHWAVNETIAPCLLRTTPS